MSGACCETSGAVTLEQVRPPDALASDRLQVALAGQPNVGKSTVFNSLTGLNQHVGNWPGKTVEQKIGVHKHGNVKLELVDLPGTYSLTANSPEELIAREYLLKQRPDAIVAIVDASILERSLYLVAELVQLGLPLVVGLNMIDVASRQGTRVDVPALSHALGVPVVALVAARNVGLDSLVEAAIEAARSATVPLHLPTLQLKLNGALAAVEHFVAPVLPEAYPLHWAAVKLLEGDSALLAQLRAAMGPTDWAALDRLPQQPADPAPRIPSAPYAWIAQAIRVAVARPAPGSGQL